MRSHCLAASLLLLTSTFAQADVLIVDPLASQGYGQVQSAVDAALDGDLVLVRTGTYAGFELSGRSLTVVADVNATVEVTSEVRVTGTPAGGSVVLGGLEIRGATISASGQAEAGLVLEDNAGFVRVDACTLRGGPPQFFSGPIGSDGGDACRVLDSARVALVGCSLFGAGGGGDSFTTGLGGRGGDALESVGSSVAIHASELTGGFGGQADIFVPNTGGPGGSGVSVLDFGVFFSDSIVRGGFGGSGGQGGAGGAALSVQASAQAQLFDVELIGGFGGSGSGSQNDGPAGPATEGTGFIAQLPGSARRLSTDLLAAQGTKLEVQVAGQPGDSVWILTAAMPAHTPALGLSGLWLAGRSIKLPQAPHAVLGPSGLATVQLTLPPMPASVLARTYFLQGFVLDGNGGASLSGPLHPTLLNGAQLTPDCNGNGSFDTCDLLDGTSIDCDGNSVPDECEQDCNGNGIVDACDIADGLATDLNSNGVLDECEPQDQTRHVDASAAPGGDGSPGAPFRAIGEAVSVSLPGDTILVADGLYAGPENRSISFTGRDLVVRSLNGPAACVIDCQQAGRAFSIQNGESAASLIEGFTIINGSGPFEGGGLRVAYSDTTVRDCVFVDCSANEGGALLFEGSDSLVEGCRFLGNEAARGGAVHIFNSAPRLLDCLFEGNSAQLAGSSNFGGAIHASTVSPLHFARLELRGNHAGTSGGGMYLKLCQVTLDQVVLTGNSANVGAALTLSRADLALHQGTLAGNVANLSGAIWTFDAAPGGELVRITNSILWDDPLAVGPSVDVLDAGYLVEIERCDVRGGSGAVALVPGATLTYGPGNLDLDPLFADADGPDNDPLTFDDNDLRLGPLSPCADAGDNTLVPADSFDLDADLDFLEPTPFDLDGLPRFEDDPAVADTGVGPAPVVDLGPWERP